MEGKLYKLETKPKSEEIANFYPIFLYSCGLVIVLRCPSFGFARFHFLSVAYFIGDVLKRGIPKPEQFFALGASRSTYL